MKCLLLQISITLMWQNLKEKLNSNGLDEWIVLRLLFTRIRASDRKSWTIMLTIYAQSLTGDIISISVPEIQTWYAIQKTLVEKVCPEDPSRLVILPYPESKEESESDDDFDELANYSTSWGLFRSWKNGDSVMYLLNDLEPFQVRFSKWMTRMFDYLDSKTTYYVSSIHIECLEKSDSQSPLFSYYFLYSPTTGTYIRSSDFEIEEDDMETFLNIRSHAIRWNNIYDMLETDEDIPSRFRHAIYRSAHRKWSACLRHEGRPIKLTPRRKATRLSTQIAEEKSCICKAYYAFRFTPPPYPRQSITSSTK